MIRIAIDGPSSAGKSTVAKQIARDLSIIYVDTGAMYRAIGLYVLRQNLDTKDAAQVCGCLPNIRIATSYHPQAGQRIFLNDEDVSEQIRSPQASMAASDVSAIPQVRAFLLSLQQDMAKKQSLIMDGRDIGTVVIPDAELKIFLTASSQSRARRRYLEYLQKGQQVEYEQVLQDVIRRDHQDSTRSAAPLCQAEDAVLIDIHRAELCSDGRYHQAADRPENRTAFADRLADWLKIRLLCPILKEDFTCSA